MLKSTASNDTTNKDFGGGSGDSVIFDNASNIRAFNNADNALAFNNADNALAFDNTDNALGFDNAGDTLGFDNAGDALLDDDIVGDSLLFDGHGEASGFKRTVNYDALMGIFEYGVDTIDLSGFGGISIINSVYNDGKNANFTFKVKNTGQKQTIHFSKFIGSENDFKAFIQALAKNDIA